MNLELGGWLWFVLDVVAVAILALTVLIAYRSYQERFGGRTPAKRSRKIDEERHRLLREGR